MPYLKKEVCSPEPLDCRILTAAMDLFVERGYHNISIHEIQKRSDVSIGSIYKHFGGKEGIAKALYKHILNEFDELIDDIIAEVESPSEQCKEIIRQLFGYTETHQNIIAYLFNAKHAEFLTDEPLICDESPFKKMREIIQHGVIAGEFKETNSWVASSTLFGGAIRMIQLRIDGTIDKPLIEYSDTVIEAAWSGLESRHSKK